MKRFAFAVLLMTWSAPAWAGGLTLSMRNGLVSLDAQDVTVRQILTEWERIGKTRIVNAERVTGGPVTLKFDGVPEKQALDIVLRSLPGYMALPRAAVVSDASLYDRILIMATTVAVAAPRQPGAGVRQPVTRFQGSIGGVDAGNITQLRQNPPAPLSPGLLPDNSDQADDPAIAAAAAAGLIPVPALNPQPGAVAVPLTPPGAVAQPQSGATAPGAGAPTNPWNAPIGTPQPSLAPPNPEPQAPPPSRVRPPQADR